ncbi:hypothetical protein PHYPSEUDO_011647 [Phytophthora pseudosyringae]|uniref:Little elongation complex subunit 2 C-terminal domain-containing protein n=1 Tax=Phytophthora pseudosyringae TaxID=221518 RepID=A0A8T1VAY7_9STRA|nr:hypothetical protein PHYPSEUDO_011647 [Phytophthora pseudosyringae]
MDTPDGRGGAFAVPRRLFAGRKRRAEAVNDADRSSFFTADDFAAFSVRGDAHQSRFYEALETRRRTLVTPVHASNSARTRSATMKIKQQSKNLAQLLVEAIEGHRIQAPEKMLELDNGRRRVSGFSVAEHEQYLVLQRKLFLAQQVQDIGVLTIAGRGLPEVLALSQDEGKQWQRMSADVEQEQVSFCRMMARGLAAEAAANETQLPLFAASWYNAMLTQCWNDIYRLYPRWFQPCMVVKLPSGGAPSGNGSAVIKANEVAARGTCCAIDLRKLGAGQPLNNTSDESGSLAMEVVSPRQAISTDAQADQLMEKYDCDLAISSSTLVALFDSDTSARFAHVPTGWGVPMKSRAIIHGSTGATKKRMFLDRPLPGNTPGTREKVAEAGRAALLSRFESKSVIDGSTGGQTAYHVWQLDDKRILVRSSTRVRMAVPSVSADAVPPEKALQDGENKKQTSAPLSVFVKPDYHLLGVEEQLTTSERCRFWLHSWLRGGSTVLVARVNPKKDTVTSWTTYSPASLIYGDNAKQSLPLECFDPSLKFQWLSTLFTALGDVPVGSYLLRPHDGCGQSTFGKKRGGVEILMATAEPGAEAPVVDLYSFMPETASKGPAPTSTTSDFKSPASLVLPSWNLRDRIPYTFQTGTYCVPFFLDGMCPNVAKGESCEHIHLRLPEQHAGAKHKPGKAKRWSFENYTKVLKKAARANFEVLNRPVRVTLNYAFCGEDKAPPKSADVYAPVHCSKPRGECSLPHFTLHQILERLANDLLRKGRGKRRAQKKEYRQHHNTAEP